MKRALFAASLILAVAVPGLAQVAFYYPQVANGADSGVLWKTSILITNPGAAGANLANVSITFTTSNGSSFPITFVDEVGTVISGTIGFQISGGQTKKFVSTGAGGLLTGYAVVNSTAQVNGTAIFSSFASDGRLIGEAGVASADLIPRQAILVDTFSGFSTGVAFANPGDGEAPITLSLINTNGTTVATTTTTLGPRQHRARFVGEQGLFQGTPPMVGTMQISSTAAPLAAMALRFDPSFQLFTTLPPVTLASIFRPVLEWFQQRPWGSPLAAIASLLG